MLRKKNHSLIVAIQRVRTLVSAMTLSISEGDPRPFRIQVARHAEGDCPAELSFAMPCLAIHARSRKAHARWQILFVSPGRK